MTPRTINTLNAAIDQLAQLYIEHGHPSLAITGGGSESEAVEALKAEMASAASQFMNTTSIQIRNQGEREQQFVLRAACTQAVVALYCAATAEMEMIREETKL